MEPMDGLVIGEAATFVEGLADIFIIAQVASLVLVSILLCSAAHAYLGGTVRRRRAFRCPLMRREVEVEFLERWVLGVRRSATPIRCSAFEVATSIECGRGCVDRSFRSHWERPISAAGSARAA